MIEEVYWDACIPHNVWELQVNKEYFYINGKFVKNVNPDEYTYIDDEWWLVDCYREDSLDDEFIVTADIRANLTRCGKLAFVISADDDFRPNISTKGANEPRYFNFPVQLLKGFITNTNLVLDNILSYAVYDFSQHQGLDADLEEAFTEYFDVPLSNFEQIIAKGEQLTSILPQNSPKTGLSTKIYLEFKDKKKTEFEKASLLGLLALKSIILKKSYFKTNKKYLLARMDGNTHAVNEFSELSPEIRKYSSQHMFGKLMEELMLSWGLKYYAIRTRGFYASFKKSLDDLALIAESKKRDHRIKLLKKMQAKASQKAKLKMAEEIENDEIF